MNLEAEMLPGPDDVDTMFAHAKPLSRPARHTPGICRMAFGRLSPAGQCPRCDELRSGGTPRRWSARNERDAQAVAAIRTHDCKASGCGPVCTFGDW